MGRHILITVEEGIARVTLDAPEEKVNILNAAFLAEFDSIAGELAARRDLQGALVLSAKKGGFIAGADIGAIEGVTDPAAGTALAREGQRIFDRWAALPFPVVAAIHGHCMGGGTEFALACHGRVAADDAAIALPETRLGILPGFGGTQRLPRLISVQKALDMVLSGRTMGAEEASRTGLVDAVVPKDRLLERATELVREAANDRRRIEAARKTKRGGLRNLLLERTAPGRALLFRVAEKNLRQKIGRHYPAPLKALEVMRKGLGMPLKQGLELEALELGRLIITPECKNLIHVYHLSQRPKKGAELAAEPLEIRKAAVLGAGVMGGGIAQLLASKKISVILKDIRPEAVEKGLDHAREIFTRKFAKKGLGEEAVIKNMGFITGTTSYREFEGVDLVVEAVVENMGVKQAVLKEVEETLSEASLIATNTSALSVTELQKVSARPQRVGGLHFFNPVDRMPLVEVVRGEQTSEQTAATLFATAVRLGKTPIIVADRPGFLVNRLLVAYLLEAVMLAEAGVERVSLDKRVKDFGLPMGPFRLIDEVGIDIAAEVGTTLAGAFPYLATCPLLERAVESGLVGKKGGAGFYLYHGEHSAGSNPEADILLGLRPEREATGEDVERLLYLILNEAGRCLEEQVAIAPEDVDTGMVFGAGFPPFLGGPCRWADNRGLQGVVLSLEKLAKTLGPRFEPCEYLKRRERFYS